MTGDELVLKTLSGLRKVRPSTHQHTESTARLSTLRNPSTPPYVRPVLKAAHMAMVCNRY